MQQSGKSTATSMPASGDVKIHSQCAQCRPAKCCGYFSVEMDEPETPRDYDDMLWMLAHRSVSIYVDEGDWFLMVHTQCTFLDLETNGCRIYETRPQMCREHSVDDCEWHGPYNFDEHFHTYHELKKWMEERGIETMS